MLREELTPAQCSQERRTGNQSEELIKIANELTLERPTWLLRLKSKELTSLGLIGQYSSSVLGLRTSRGS
jgi:hypothetical protein